MKEMTCIVCPNGCCLKVENINGEYTVTGNQCKRGAQFAVSEMTHPVRTICSTVATIWPEVPVIPVRVSEEIPKEEIFRVMEEINHVTIREPFGRGDVVIANVRNLGADVIVTSDRLKKWLEGEKKDEHKTI